MTKEQSLNIINNYKKSKYIDINDLISIVEFLETDFEYFKNQVNPQNLSAFLFWNCDRFNRFSVPTPYVLEKDSFLIFTRLLMLFKKVEKTNDNYACLEIDYLQWKIFDYISNQKGNNPDSKEIKVFVNDLKKIKYPKHAGKLKEFNEHKSHVMQLISGFLNSSLITKIETILPVSPVRKETIINTTYLNCKTEIKLSPTFHDSRQSLLKTGSSDINIAVTKSQWQTCICEVTIKVYGLIDPIARSPILSLPYNHKLPYDSWPFIFNYVYNLIEKVSWNIYNIEDQIGRWLISPSDLGKLTWSLYSNTKKVKYITKDPPSLLSFLTKKSVGINIINIDNIDYELDWHYKCLILAQDKLSEGNTNEALFWLNIGIESLFESRSRKICANNNIDYDVLNSGKTYWLNAKELVKKYIPDKVDEIKWPLDSIGIPSWYSKIKFLDKSVGFKVSKNEILKHYSKIHRFRNSLFHGDRANNIDSKIVNECIDSYNWLVSNFK